MDATPTKHHYAGGGSGPGAGHQKERLREFVYHSRVTVTPRTNEAPGAAIWRWWTRLSALPFGRTLFSVLIGRMAPYTGSMGARVQLLEPGHAVWTLRDRRAVRNHLRSVHAVALVNLAEVTSGTAMLTALPAGTRGIVTELSISYLKKARGLLTAECRCTLPPLDSETSHDVHAEVRDETGDVVARARVTWLLSPAAQPEAVDPGAQ